MWERFSFYGMRALLTLYLTKQMGYSDEAAYAVFGAYGALVYAFPVVGGLLADRLLGYRLAIVLGGLLMAVGHFVLTFPSELTFFAALALICLGNGFFKPSISSLVGALYEPGDERRDGGFTIFYMGINLGAFLAPILCGTLGETYGWHYGFGLAGIGMLCGLAWFLLGRRKLEGHGLAPDTERLTRAVALGVGRLHLVLLGVLATVPVVALGLKHNHYVGWVLYGVGAVVLAVLLRMAFSSDRVQRDQLLLVIVLIVFDVAFWSFFEQAGSSLTLFTERNVDRVVLGYELKTSQFNAVNSIFIVALAPLFAGLWRGLQRVGRNPSIPMKFSLGIVQVGLGFACLVVGARLAGPDGRSAVVWLVLTYLVHTTGELCISPVGLSAMTKLAPERAVGTVMGAWFLSFSFAEHLGAGIARLTAGAGGAGTGAALSPTQSLGVYAHVFTQITWAGVGIGVLLALLAPLLKRLTHGVE